MKRPGKNAMTAVGISIGLVVGAATHNIPLWLLIGLGWSVVLRRMAGDKAKDDAETDKK